MNRPKILVGMSSRLFRASDCWPRRPRSGSLRLDATDLRRLGSLDEDRRRELVFSLGLLTSSTEDEDSATTTELEALAELKSGVDPLRLMELFRKLDVLGLKTLLDIAERASGPEMVRVIRSSSGIVDFIERSTSDSALVRRR